MRWLVRCPLRLSSVANCRTLLQVHRSADSGSPRVTGSTNASRSRFRVASWSTVRFLPAPFRLLRRSLKFSHSTDYGSSGQAASLSHRSYSAEAHGLGLGGGDQTARALVQ